MKITIILTLMAPVFAFSANVHAYAAASALSSPSEAASLGLYDLSYAIDAAYSSRNFERSGIGLAQDSAYDLVIRGDEAAGRSFTYRNQDMPFEIGAKYAPANTVSDSDTVGFLVNTWQGPYEVAMAYHQSAEQSGSIKGRLTYKSRNTSQVRLDLVAERYTVNVSRPEADTTLSKSGDSLSFLVGAKYQVTPKAYVSGQYGAVGFTDTSKNEGAELDSGRDYWALSLEAGYKLNDSGVIYVSHAQKQFNDVAEADESGAGLLASQLNSIGVRLNW